MTMSELNQLRWYNIDYQSYFLLKAGIKPVIRTGITENVIKDLENFCKKFEVFVLIKKMNKLYGQKLDKPFISAYISLSEKLAIEAYEAEKNEDRLEFGKLLGYPKCCTKNFIKNLKKEEEYTILSYKNTRTKSSFFCNNTFNFDSKVGFKDTLKIFKNNYQIFNKVEDLFLIRHIPCSFDCKKSIEIGEKTLKILKKEMPEFAEKILNAIKRPILHFDYFNWVVFDGEVDDNNLKYKKILPFKSLFPEDKLTKIKNGSRIKVSKDKILVLKNYEKLLEIPKKNEYNGIIIDFS